MKASINYIIGVQVELSMGAIIPIPMLVVDWYFG